jgi:two-component system, OmpR family, response regulator
MNNRISGRPRLARPSPAPPTASYERILLIEDDVQIAQLVKAELSDVGFEVHGAATGTSGMQSYEAARPDLIILDLSLPDVDGLMVCQRIRAVDQVTPILMLTARATKHEVVRGLEWGADEYLTKPFDTLELIARTRALFRRAAAYGDAEIKRAGKALRRGALELDPVRRAVFLDRRPISLTAKEFELLLVFLKHPGRTFTRDELLSHVWGSGFEGFEHTVNTHINRLRSKIERDPKKPCLIETVWGVGYRLGESAR